VQPLEAAELDTVHENIQHRLRDIVGGDLGDDLALLAAEYRPEQSHE
jgi:hypothetical protein